MASFKGEPILKADANDKLDAGIDRFGGNLIDPLPIFQKCGFYRDALLKGGKDNGQPQWNLAILGTTFMEKGNRSSCFQRSMPPHASIASSSSAIQRDMPHGAVVLNPYSAAGRVWFAPNEVVNIAEFNETGERLRIKRSSEDGSTDFYA
jgi:hypothetical protein